VPAKGSAPPRRGRPPIEAAESHAAISDAVYELLQERSVRDLTMEAVAKRAGVGKPTLYKWWPTKAALVLAMFRERIAVALPAPSVAKLQQLDGLLAKHPGRDAGAVERRIGRWLGRYPAAEKLLDVQVERNGQGQATGLKIVERGERSAWLKHAHGAYLLRTNCPETDPVKLWRWYIQLQQAEAAFRTSKNDLALRPLYHQKTERVEAHILVCFLALALWRTLEMWMRSKGMGTCARQLLLEVSTIRSMDVILPVKNRGQLRLRVLARPDKPVAQLLAHLGLPLPNSPKIVQNVVEKIA